MRAWLARVVAVLGLILSGCASTIQSDVLAFHEWPAKLPDRHFVFAPIPPQYNPLEHRAYEGLVRAELQRVGLSEASDAKTARLRVSLNYSTNLRDVQVVQPVVTDPYWYNPPFYSPFYYPGWPRFGHFGPYYDPFWYGPPMVQYQNTNYQVYQHQLRIMITQLPEQKTLYDVTVNSESMKAPLSTAMPYMVRSAFQEFPGQSGVHREVEMKLAN
jgi:hypothetical protein